jgi:hypothetical protein
MTRPRAPRGVRDWAGALLATYAFRTVAGLLLALPVMNAIQASGVTQWPEADRLLFEPGAEVLMEVLVSQRASLVASITPTLAMLAIIAVLALGPELLMLRAASSSRRYPSMPSPEKPAPAARPLLQRLLTLGAATLIARALLAGLWLALAFTARSWFTSARDPRIADMAFVGALGVGVLFQIAVSALRDLAAAAIVAGGLPVPDGVATALSKLRARSFGTCAAAFAVGILLVLAGALVAGAIDVSQPQSWRVAAVFVVHQAVVLGSIAVRAAWLSSAVGRVASTPHSSGSISRS